MGAFFEKSGLWTVKIAGANCFHRSTAISVMHMGFAWVKVEVSLPSFASPYSKVLL